MSTLQDDFDRAQSLFDSKKHSDAFALFQKGATYGHAPSQSMLAFCYENGYGVKQNKKEAIHFYTLAANQGRPGAQYNLALYFERGEIVAKDLSEAARLYGLAAKQGHKEAQYNRAYAYYSGSGVEQDYKQAFQQFQAAASQNYPQAISMLAFMYENGYGCSKDVNEAVRYYKQAAEAGRAGAQYRLAGYYERGEHMSKDMSQALKWYRAAADQGNESAQYALAYCYYEGTGVTKSNEEAIKWFNKSADAGYAQAQSMAAYMYENGYGVTRSTTEAVRLYKLAAAQNRPGAQYKLGVYYEKGEVVPKDMAEAVRLYSLAAEAGYSEAKTKMASTDMQQWKKPAGASASSKSASALTEAPTETERASSGWKGDDDGRYDTESGPTAPRPAAPRRPADVSSPSPSPSPSSSSSSSSSVDPTKPAASSSESIASLSTRVQDVEYSDLCNINPILGIVGAAEVPFDESIEMTGLKIKPSVRCAKLFARQYVESHSNCKLTADEIACIHLYTQESPFYKTLNLLLRSRDRTALRNYFPYLRLFMGGLRKLPFFKGTLFRGVKLDILTHYNKNATIVWWACSSTSTGQHVWESSLFCGKEGKRTLFIIEAKHAIDISPYSAIGAEEERILLPGATLKVKSTADLGDVKTVSLEETDEPIILMEFDE